MPNAEFPLFRTKIRNVDPIRLIPVTRQAPDTQIPSAAPQSGDAPLPSDPVPSVPAITRPTNPGQFLRDGWPQPPDGQPPTDPGDTPPPPDGPVLAGLNRPLKKL